MEKTRGGAESKVLLGVVMSSTVGSGSGSDLERPTACWIWSEE